MNDESVWVELKEILRSFTVWIVTSLFYASFLALWIAIQWLVSNKIIALLKLNWIDQIVLTVIQIMFAISTLAPVAITIYRDIRIMLIRTQRKIRKEIKIGDDNEAI